MIAHAKVSHISTRKHVKRGNFRVEPSRDRDDLSQACASKSASRAAGLSKSGDQRVFGLQDRYVFGGRSKVLRALRVSCHSWIRKRWKSRRPQSRLRTSHIVPTNHEHLLHWTDSLSSTTAFKLSLYRPNLESPHQSLSSSRSSSYTFSPKAALSRL